MKSLKNVFVSSYSRSMLPDCPFDDSVLHTIKDGFASRLIYMAYKYHTKKINMVLGAASNISGCTPLIMYTILERKIDLDVTLCINTSLDNALKKYSEYEGVFIRDLIASKTVNVIEFEDIDSESIHDHIMMISDAAVIFAGPNIVWKPLIFSATFYGKQSIVIPFNKKETDILECHSNGDIRFSSYYAEVNLPSGERNIIKNIYDTVSNAPLLKSPFMVSPVSPVKDQFVKYLWIMYFLQNPLIFENASMYSRFIDTMVGENSQLDFDQSKIIEWIVSIGLDKAIEESSTWHTAQMLYDQF